MSGGKPGVEREESAFHGEAHAHHAGQHRKRIVEAAVRHQRSHSGAEVRHQQVAGDRVKHRHSEEEHAAAHQTHHQVADSGDNGLPAVLCHDDAAGGNGVDFNEHIAGEHVVGVAQCEERCSQQVHHNVVEILLLRQDILLQILSAAEQRKEHDQAEHRAQQRLDGTAAQFVAPGSREGAHGIAETLTPHSSAGKHGGVQPRAHQQHRKRRGTRLFPFMDQGGHDPAEQGKEHAEEREVFVKSPHASVLAFLRLHHDLVDVQ